MFPEMVANKIPERREDISQEGSFVTLGRMKMEYLGFKFFKQLFYMFIKKVNKG